MVLQCPSVPRRQLCSYIYTMKTTQDLISAITEKNFVQATIHKPRPYSPYKKIAVRPVKIDGRMKYQATYTTALQDQVQNFSMDDLKIQMHMWLVTNFFFADVKTTKEDIQLMQSPKGQVTINRKKAFNKPKSTDHDRKKLRLIPQDAPFLRALGLASNQGRIHSHGQKKYKQINRYVELMSSLIGDDKVQKVIDMGSGKGYLTFALYEYLQQQNPKVKVQGVELRQDLVDKCNAVAKKSGYKGLSFVQGSIEDAKVSKVDMVIALHACDIATDMAIAKGVKAGAKYIAVAPCCHKQIRKAMGKTKTVLQPLIAYGILKERQAEMVTDTIRALLLQSEGYKTNVFEFIDLEHTAKNVMITGALSGKKITKARREIADIKAEFGISEHYLETLL